MSKARKVRESILSTGNCDLRTKALIQFPILSNLLHEIDTEYLEEAGQLEEINQWLSDKSELNSFS